MRDERRSAGEQTAVSSERLTEVAEIVGRVTHWAPRRPDITAVLMAGSYARNAARPDSDIDLVLLTTDKAQYADGDWVRELAPRRPDPRSCLGSVTEWRFRTPSGLEVELDIGSLAWADTNPVDPGTRRVVADGARALYDGRPRQPDTRTPAVMPYRQLSLVCGRCCVSGV